MHRTVSEIDKFRPFTMGESAAGLAVKQAERPDPQTGQKNEWRTGVKPDERRAGRQRVGPETRVAMRVRHNENSVFQDRIIAECDIARSVVGIEPLARHEKLDIFGQQGDRRHLGPEMRFGFLAQRVQGWHVRHIGEARFP
ncbi:MAG: hypothetical protein JJU18_08600 [Oceanicaulis sp.]|nr:hypothetical protein [Oceanicaulis sp.]